MGSWGNSSIYRNLSSLSKLYGVSLDYLLNDEEDELTPKDDEEDKGETVTSKMMRKVQ